MFEVARSMDVGCRSDLARLSNRRNHRVAVEVGTDRGLFAKEFLDKWNGEILYCVDAWETYAEMGWDRTGDLFMAALTLQHDARRVRLIRSTSVETAQCFRNVAPGFPPFADFVYIDAAHDHESVLADLNAWWPVVTVSGGILAGDDFDQEHADVMKAVMGFGQKHGVRVLLTTDYDRPPSWYIQK